VQDKKFFCYEIYKNLSVASNNGVVEYSPCCVFKGYTKKSNDLILDLGWNNTVHQQIKYNVENNIPNSGCNNCYLNEQKNIGSRRQAAQQLYEQYYQDTNLNLSAPQSLDYRVGNLCNLKCMICGPESSSAWIPDYKKIWPLKDVSRFSYKKMNQVTLSDENFLRNLKFLHFHGGGEPFLSDAHFDLLCKIKKIKGLGDVRVTYNTNATVRVTSEILDIWQECQLVELYFSIDDIEQRFEYQRTGANWQQVCDNLQWYYKNMPHNHMFNINCVWSHLNLFYLTDLVNWYKTFFQCNRYGDPINLIFQPVNGPFNINQLSPDLQLVLLNQFENYPELKKIVNSIPVNSSSDHKIFLDYVDKIDSVRKNKFSEICPEWFELISK